MNGRFKNIAHKISGKIRTAKTVKYTGVLIAVVILVWGCSALGDFFGMGIGDGTKKMVNIPKGSGIKQISEILKDEGIIRHKLLFRLYQKFDNDGITQQGGHLIGKGQSYKAILNKITSVPEVGVDEIVSVVIPEGFEAEQIAERLAKQGLADKKTFLKELEEGEFDFEFIKQINRRENRLEGYLFPATYEIVVGESEHKIINRMLDAFDKKIMPLYRESGTSKSLDDIVIMASLVEREAANDNERGKVASVFYNRLKMNMPLGSCATVQYIIKERKDILSNSDIKIKSDYNTYINKGLPIGPIASPGEASVLAALYPEETDYLYFVAKNDGSENVFTKTGEEHLNMVNKIQNGN
jgi:UPF0755 protein